MCGVTLEKMWIQIHPCLCLRIRIPVTPPAGRFSASWVRLAKPKAIKAQPQRGKATTSLKSIGFVKCWLVKPTVNPHCLVVTVIVIVDNCNYSKNMEKWKAIDIPIRPEASKSPRAAILQVCHVTLSVGEKFSVRQRRSGSFFNLRIRRFKKLNRTPFSWYFHKT